MKLTSEKRVVIDLSDVDRTGLAEEFRKLLRFASVDDYPYIKRIYRELVVA